MDKRQKLRTLVESMDASQLSMLSEELASRRDPKADGIDLDDITADRMRDPAFAAAVRAELDAVLKGQR